MPAVNLDAHLDADNVNMVTCGGQATIPIVHAIDRVADVAYARDRRDDRERAAPAPARARTSTSSPRRRRAGSSAVGGADEAKAIIILNPADPPILMRDTVFAHVREPDAAAIERVGRGDGRARSRAYVPGYRLKLCDIDGDLVTVMLEIEGAGDFLPRLRRQPRHHDRRRRARRRASWPQRDAGRGGAARMTHVTLVDSSAARRHALRRATFTPAQVAAVAAGLDAAGVDAIEVVARRRPRRLLDPVRRSRARPTRR